jgi:hypothetical protein
MFGGHWNSTGPSRCPRGATASRNVASRSPVFFSRTKWVMPWFALHAKTKLSSVAFDQPSIIEAVGDRRNV